MLENIKFDENGLVPAIVQDINTKAVLMMAYMNEESIKKTLETKTTWFYSRSRKELWNKGATSGNIQNLKKMSYDCDGDTILMEVEIAPDAVACHTGKYSCFYNEMYKDEEFKKFSMNALFDLITDRKENPVEGSYTNYLFDKGIDKILKKVGEESAEVIIASKNPDLTELQYEIGDLVYHTLVLMVERGLKLEDIAVELAKKIEIGDMEKHFCTCEDLTCKFNPHNGVANCDLCIKKNLAKREIPSCFFRKISNDLSNQNDFSFEAFSELLKQNS